MNKNSQLNEILENGKKGNENRNIEKLVSIQTLTILKNSRKSQEKKSTIRICTDREKKHATQQKFHIETRGKKNLK